MFELFKRFLPDFVLTIFLTTEIENDCLSVLLPVSQKVLRVVQRYITEFDFYLFTIFQSVLLSLKQLIMFPVNQQ